MLTVTEREQARGEISDDQALNKKSHLTHYVPLFSINVLCFIAGPVLEGTSLTGTCSPLLGGEGDVCDSSCGCKTGTEMIYLKA